MLIFVSPHKMIFEFLLRRKLRRVSSLSRKSVREPRELFGDLYRFRRMNFKLGRDTLTATASNILSAQRLEIFIGSQSAKSSLTKVATPPDCLYEESLQ